MGSGKLLFMIIGFPAAIIFLIVFLAIEIFKPDNPPKNEEKEKPAAPRPNNPYRPKEKGFLETIFSMSYPKGDSLNSQIREAGGATPDFLTPLIGLMAIFFILTFFSVIASKILFLTRTAPGLIFVAFALMCWSIYDLIKRL